MCFGQEKMGGVVGRILDGETKEPLTGANIFLRSTFIGATSDASGRFRISRIPAGLYTVQATMVGYRSQSLENVEVRGGIENEIEVELMPAPIQSEQVVVTASRYEQNLKEVPVSISTVTAEAIADRVSVTLDDALRYVPGVNMMQDQVNIRGSTGYSRGVGSRVLILFDGLPYTTGDTGEITWETFPMHQIDRIEVVKGAGSALYGSSALGGVVNVITKEIPTESEVRWRLYSGMYDKPRFQQWVWSDRTRFHNGGHVSFSGNTGTVAYLGSIARSVDESYKENDVYHRWGFFTKLRFSLAPTRSIGLVANVSWRTHGNFFWWKSLAEATRPAESQRNGNVDSQRGNVSFCYKEFVSQDLFYTVKAVYYGNFWRDDSAGHMNNVSASHVFYGEGQVTHQTSEYNTITFGASANYDQVNSNIFGSHPGVGGALYFQDDLKLTPEWKFTLGFRADWQRVSALPSASQFSPKLGVVYLPAEETSLRLSLGAGFRYPSISELYTAVSTGVSSLAVVPNINLKPERSLSAEIGLSQWLTESIRLECAVFQNDFDHLIEAGVDPVNLVIQFDNVTKARIRGIEAGLTSTWFEKAVSCDLSYTYTDPVDLDRGSVLKFRPRHLLYASVGADAGALHFSVDARYVSRVEAIDDNLVRLAPIINGDQRVPIRVVDTRVKYDLLDSGLPLRVGLNVTNLLNYHYVELIGNLSPVRTFTLVVEGVF